MTRTYSKKEISKILTRASEIQSQQEQQGITDGLTEQELMHISEEVGIDKAAILEALKTFDDPEFNSKFDWIKGTTKVQHISSVNGEISADNWDDLVREIRRITGGIGKITVTGKSYEWEQRRGDFGYRHLTLTPSNGRTEIQYVSGWNSLKFLIYMGVSMALLAPSAVIFKSMGYGKIALLFAIATTAVGLFPISRVILNQQFNKQRVQLKKLVEGISSKISSIKSPTIQIEDEQVYADKTSISNSSESIKH
ncbi:hypothetical protein [Balneola vulgaris]|uniref:hypothetical protein n=1 Tax=Balneola vulgaris TaxID=287535 RepID=UPI00037520B2|nr:hypothetical protein [Balneola vulgaris]